MKSTSPGPPDAGVGRLFLGVDIGGTTLSVGLVDERGAFVGSPKDMETVGGGTASPVWWEPLGDDHEPKFLASRARRLVEAALAAAGGTMASICRVGVCTPGLLDIPSGLVKSAANLKGWDQVPVCDIFAEALGLERSAIVLENDTNAALLAEAWVGAAKGHTNVVLMTLGTGIGGAIMCDGRLLRGSKGQAGEIGHAILVPDGRSFGRAGVNGIFEGYASASAVARAPGWPSGRPRSPRGARQAGQPWTAQRSSGERRRATRTPCTWSGRQRGVPRHRLHQLLPLRGPRRHPLRWGHGAGGGVLAARGARAVRRVPLDH